MDHVAIYLYGIDYYRIVGEEPCNEVALQAGRDMKRLYPKAKKSTLQLKPQFDCTHVFTGKVPNSISQC